MSFASTTAVPARRTPFSVLFSLVAGGIVVLAVGVWLMRDAVSLPVAAAAQPPGPASPPSSAIEQELRIEKDRVESLSRELESARQDLAAQAARAADRDTLAQEAAVLRKALSQMGTEMAETEEALTRERARSRELERALQQDRASVPVETTAATPPPEPAAESSDVTRLMTRARELLEQGNIGAARAILERAAELGSASAVFALAETYDPDRLASWGTSGTQGDPAKARDLYIKALAGGVTAAKGRLEALPKEPAK
jgi:TPR repeat protein